ncbi:MAG: ATP synthase subunit I [Actinomycetota bacterium]
MVVDILIGAGAGLLAGTVFFAGLGWTVARLPRTRRPLLLSLGSLAARSALLVAVVLVTSQGRLWRVVASLMGILAVRTAMVAWVRRRPAGGASWT